MDYNVILLSLAWAMLSSTWAMLSLPWALSQLGWIFGSSTIIIFSTITYFTSHLLSISCSNDNQNYDKIAKEHLNNSDLKVYKILKHANRIGAALGMTITASTTILSILRYNCSRKNAGNKNENDPCFTDEILCIILLGVVQVIISQIPKFEKQWWFSSLAALMAFTYSAIAIGLGIRKIEENKTIRGSMTGVNLKMLKKIWTSLTAVGNVAFGYSYYIILVEIKEKIKSPPQELKSVNIAALISGILTTTFFILCAWIGYGTFGVHSSENLLIKFDFGFYNHYWLITLASFAMMIHLIGAFQVFAQPVYLAVDKIVLRRFGNSDFIQKDFEIPIACKNTPLRINLFRLVWRSSFITITMLISILLPYFNNIIGFLGAIGFCPLTVYFPVKIYFVHDRTPKWSRKWIYLQILNISSWLVSVAAAFASLFGITSSTLE